MNETDIPWLMAKLREMLDEYERQSFSPDWYALWRRTYRRHDNGSGVTLVLGMEPAEDDEDD